MTVLLGGRAAEQLVFGEISTGAADDLMKVTEIARSMVTRYGMDPALGQAAYETERGSYLGQPIEGGGRRFSEDTAREIDVAVRERIERTYQKALDILRGRRAELPLGQGAARESPPPTNCRADPAAGAQGVVARPKTVRSVALIFAASRPADRTMRDSIVGRRLKTSFRVRFGLLRWLRSPRPAVRVRWGSSSSSEASVSPILGLWMVPLGAYCSRRTFPLRRPVGGAAWLERQWIMEKAVAERDPRWWYWTVSMAIPRGW
jgi:hypothetical protein